MINNLERMHKFALLKKKNKIALMIFILLLCLGFLFAIERYNKHRGVIIADEPGSGKTLQALAFAAHLIETYQNTAPVLILVPSAVLKNWENECNKFMSDLTVVTCPTDEKQSSKRVSFFFANCKNVEVW